MDFSSNKFNQSQEDLLRLLAYDHRICLNDKNNISENQILEVLSLIHGALESNLMLDLKHDYLKEFSSSNLLVVKIYNIIDDNTRKDDRFIRLIELLLAICLYMVKFIPETVQQLSAFKDRLNLRVTNLSQRLLINKFKEFEKSFNNSKEIISMELSNERPSSSGRIGLGNFSDRFEQLSIIPTLNDILVEQNTFLRKNVTNGAYKDVYTYLDTHFRLLREDFMMSLRESVKAFREQVRKRNIILFIEII